MNPINYGLMAVIIAMVLLFCFVVDTEASEPDLNAGSGAYVIGPRTEEN